MQFLISVIDDTTGSATPEEMASIDAFNERLVTDGHWVFAGGLSAPAKAVVIDDRDGAALFSDGPFVETKEYVAGFWIIEADDLETARELAAASSRHCNRRVELRSLLGG